MALRTEDPPEWSYERVERRNKPEIERLYRGLVRGIRDLSMQDWDLPILDCGMEGTGKSAFAINLACDLDNDIIPHLEDHVLWDVKKDVRGLEKRIKHLDPTVFILDEAGKDLLSRNAMEKEQKQIIELAMVMREYNHILILDTTIGGDWPVPPDETTPWPSYNLIDYVRVYQQSGDITPTPTTAPIPTTAPTATPGGSSTVMHVDDIAMSYQKTGRNYFAKATVTVVDPYGAPVEGATVYGTFSGATNDSRSGVTDANGQVMLQSAFKKDGGTWTFCVDDVVKDGWTYDAAANVETCDGITAP